MSARFFLIRPDFSLGMDFSRNRAPVRFAFELRKICIRQAFGQSYWQAALRWPLRRNLAPGQVKNRIGRKLCTIIHRYAQPRLDSNRDCA